MVWNENERLLELLTEAALDDLVPSIVTCGQLNPASARERTGIIEVADGKPPPQDRHYYRQRVTACWWAIWTTNKWQPFRRRGNNYRQTSAYERGRRYRRLLEGKFEMPRVTALASAEKVDRKIITRCLATANLPIEVIKLFANPSEPSACAGHELSGIYANHTEEMMRWLTSYLPSKAAANRSVLR
ncbi:hypothetical protein [Pantoea stewartii]|uniref:hypothetical protein n=1 Tax=Pantoea stewartii TaxID=66269 RepID=UPI0025A2063B|nr:hypothetical protein [Pantoea stewartii]